MKKNGTKNQKISPLYQAIHSFSSGGIPSGAGHAIYLEPEWQLWFWILRFYRDFKAVGEKDEQRE